MTNIIESSAIICHNLSTYELYMLLSNKQKPKFLQKCPKIIICMIIFAVSCLIYSYQFFSYRVGVYGSYERNNFTNKTEFVFSNYGFAAFDFNDSLPKKIIQTFALAWLYGVNLAILIGLNLMILYKVKSVILRKKTLLKKMPTIGSSNNNSKKINQIKNSERTTAIMVLLVSFSYMIE